MIRILSKAVLLFCAGLLFSQAAPGILYGKDMRADYVKLRQKKEALVKRAAEEAEKAAREAEAARLKILKDKKALKDAVAARQAKNEELKARIAAINRRLKQLDARRGDLQLQYDRTGGPVKEIAAFTRSYASDLEAVVNRSPQTALDKNRDSFLKGLAESDSFPSMEDIGKMVDLLLDEAEKSGEVRLERGAIIDPSGMEVGADLLMVGNLTALYRTETKTGYALYSKAGRRFFALSREPSFWVSWRNRRYFSGKADALYLDISEGRVLRQIAHKPGFLEQVSGGGPVVWPIIIVFVIGLAITGERFFFLKKRVCDTDRFMASVGRMVSAGDWDSCRSLCERESPKSVPKVIGTALEFRDMSREDMENSLQESILNEIPRLERFLSTLGLLAAIAPLLGLLGTVTGMIHTFQVMTYYGATDPRMMSGGISEALVTTMLGLCAAIPLMFGHTLLTRRVDTIVSEMEEKAVSFVNIVFKSRKNG